MAGADDIVRGLLVVIVVAIGTVLGWVLFVRTPDNLAQLLGVLLVVAVAVATARIGSNIASSLLPVHNVAEVAVEGPISRDGGSGITSPPVGASADDIVEQIERADEDRGSKALLLKLNTPGGEIVPSEDIRIAAEEFDGPTIAYATDVCASGGYDIAAGCDELWAREGSIVGSIGVVGSRVNAKELADRLGLSYEQFTAGEYKDAGVPLKEMSEDEREYLQGIVDDYYDQFIDTVAEGREMDTETLKATEARIFLGEEADERGLVDRLGTRDDVEASLEQRLGEDVTIKEYEPERGLAGKLRGGTQQVAFALGAGIAGVADGDIEGLSFRR
ncbi:signal peptide peptidase SppA [Haloarcula sp. Atlit-47R]|uniref:signal peptide peptidase SppA n=1 Tax=Haloarcula sp. Atlit-47R TaxID=2282132 RepID=UPI000EF27F87|nr:signal peptide peptidase SppA [Haloarcula sp. Atlit-47R]RLM42202.1 signal peptide peptidase SppA [Haloarcula sp. Atlit-47R]